MKQGYLSQYFKGVAAKTLSAVEADSASSNQHEFNGVTPLKKLFGIEKQKYSTRFIYLCDNDIDPPTDDGFLTWYDAREKHPTRTEHRMYFPTTAVSTCASAGDALYICLKPDDTILAIVAENGSTIANQIHWLFGLTEAHHPGFSIREELESEQDRIAFASRFILEQIGIEIEEKEETYLDDMLRRFGMKFPETAVFSEYARSTLSTISSWDNPDDVLMAWMEREEILFRTLEKHIVSEDLSKRTANGFDGDVDGMAKYFLSMQNRRKSRAGLAFENHVEHLLKGRNIRFDRAKITENKAKPDFIFPGITEYHDRTFDITRLTMLGVKTTCKDRWRQVLTEAKKIPHKHLLTLEVAISENQTNEMKSNNLQLVVPSAISSTYSKEQQKWLMNMNDFLQMVESRQTI
ncbi:MAG: type II restriction endonuclease [Defluviitaleaceae bacterium]|nr:type II restriction endonuclease [Defluviitaleaceae bacterium]